MKRFICFFSLYLSSCNLNPNYSLLAKENKCDLKENFVRNWEKSPAVYQTKTTSPLYIVGDVHGSFDILKNILLKANLVSQNNEWIGENAILVFVGDVINKGKNSLKVIEYIQNLQISSQKKEGKVIVLYGNHEIGFLDNPYNKKFKPFLLEIEKEKLSLCEDIYTPSSKIGDWLRNFSAAAKINHVYISHTGWWDEKSILEIEKSFQKIVNEKTWNTKFTCGEKGATKKGLGFFTARSWWGKKGEEFFKAQEGLEALQIVFGHDPNAFKKRAEIVGYFAKTPSSGLIKTDVGMVSGESSGSLLKCTSWREDGSCPFERMILKDEKAIFEPVPLFEEAPFWKEEEEEDGC